MMQITDVISSEAPVHAGGASGHEATAPAPQSSMEQISSHEHRHLCLDVPQDVHDAVQALTPAASTVQDLISEAASPGQALVAEAEAAAEAPTAQKLQEGLQQPPPESRQQSAIIDLANLESRSMSAQACERLGFSPGCSSEPMQPCLNPQPSMQANPHNRGGTSDGSCRHGNGQVSKYVNELVRVHTHRQSHAAERVDQQEGPSPRRRAPTKTRPAPQRLLPLSALIPGPRQNKTLARKQLQNARMLPTVDSLARESPAHAQDGGNAAGQPRIQRTIETSEAAARIADPAAEDPAFDQPCDHHGQECIASATEARNGRTPVQDHTDSVNEDHLINDAPAFQEPSACIVGHERAHTTHMHAAKPRWVAPDESPQAPPSRCENSAVMSGVSRSQGSIRVSGTAWAAPDKPPDMLLSHCTDPVRGTPRLQEDVRMLYISSRGQNSTVMSGIPWSHRDVRATAQAAAWSAPVAPVVGAPVETSYLPRGNSENMAICRGRVLHEPGNHPRSMQPGCGSEHAGYPAHTCGMTMNPPPRHQRNHATDFQGGDGPSTAPPPVITTGLWSQDPGVMTGPDDLRRQQCARADAIGVHQQPMAHSMTTAAPGTPQQHGGVHGRDEAILRGKCWLALPSVRIYTQQQATPAQGAANLIDQPAAHAFPGKFAAQGAGPRSASQFHDHAHTHDHAPNHDHDEDLGSMTPDGSILQGLKGSIRHGTLGGGLPRKRSRTFMDIPAAGETSPTLCSARPDLIGVPLGQGVHQHAQAEPLRAAFGNESQPVGHQVRSPCSGPSAVLVLVGNARPWLPYLLVRPSCIGLSVS